MPETKINLNYQVKQSQFDDKVGDAITTGGASDELDDRINSKYNTVAQGSEYVGGHTHSGAYLDGEKISYNNLKDIPAAFPPASHHHPFDDITGDIAWAQIDALVTTDPNDPDASHKLINAADPRLSDSRDPNPHTHPFTDITGDISWSQIDSLISTSNESQKLIEANDPRLSDKRDPNPHDNSAHTENYITAADVTYENLDANGDVGNGPGQLADGLHNHDDIYYRQAIVDSKLDGKANLSHTHNSGDIRAGALAADVSYQAEQIRYFSYIPLGFGGWNYSPEGYIYKTLDTTGDRSYIVPIRVPDESIIKRVSIYAASNGSHSLEVKLKSKPFNNKNANEEASTFVDEDTSGIIKEYNITNIDLSVDNSNNAYFIEFEEDNSITDGTIVEIHGIRIEVGILKPLP